VVHSTGDGQWVRQDVGTFTGGIAAVWSSSPGDIYTVGSGATNLGVVLHSTGNGTWMMQSPGNVTLAAMWGSDSADLYAVGTDTTTQGGGIVHSTGNGTWMQQQSGSLAPLHGVWSSSRGDVYAVGAGGTILHSTGSNDWMAQNSLTSVDLFGVWGSGAGDVYVVGSFQGVIKHSIGDGSWTLERQTDVSMVQNLQGVFGAGGDVIAVGRDGNNNAVILHKRE
jgi:hypothetical protein